MGFKARLEKVIVHLPNHWAYKAESMWARPLGGGTYEIRNIPFFAYNLNQFDVVSARAASRDLKPVVRALVRKGGHQTLRVIFAKDDKDAKTRFLEQLEAAGLDFELFDALYATIDVPPDVDFDAAEKLLIEWQERGVLSYETCEERVPGSFDAAPNEP